MSDDYAYENEEEHGVVISGSLEIDKENDPRWTSLTYEKDRNQRLWTYDEKGKLICGAITRDGSPCRKSPIKGRNRCRFHGGKSLAGADHPNAKELRYSRYFLDRRMLNKFEAAFDDPDLLSLKANIAITDTRLAELIESLKSGESLKAWERMREAYDNFVDCHNRGDSVGAVEYLNEMGRLIRFGVGEHQKWREIKDMQAHRRQLSETEHKMQHDMKQVMTSDQAMGLLAFAVNTVRKNIFKYFPDERGQECMAAISQEISAKVYTDPKTVRVEDDF